MNSNMNCIICNELIDLNTTLICGNKECEYKSRTNFLNDNYVKDYIQNNNEESLFLLSSAINALDSGNIDLYNPIPYYINNELDFNTIKTILISKINTYSNIQRILTEVNSFSNELEIYNNYDKYFYGFLRFTFKSNLLNIKLDNIINVKHMNLYKVSYFEYDNDEFKNEIDNKGYCYLFHGSNIFNWYSIISNGLKIFSNTKRMTNGAAYGKGIYLSDSYSFSKSYSSKSSINNVVVGVFKVIGKKEQYIKTSQIYVVNNDKLLQLEYIVWNIKKNNSNENNINIAISNYFNDNIINNENNKQKYLLGLKNKRLLKEIKSSQEINSEELGLEFEIDELNILKWNVNIFNIDENSKLYKDMDILNISKIKMELLLPKEYPLYPPFIRIIEPRFEYLTGHITLGGSICMELLTSQGWSPAYSIENLMIHIKSLIIEGEGRIDKKKYNIPYSLDEAKNAFKRMLISHNWK